MRVQWEGTCGLAEGGGVAGGVGEDGDEDVKALAVDEDGLEVGLAAQARQSGRGAVLHHAVCRVHAVHDLVQHLALDLVLQPLQRLLHAVLRRLHKHTTRPASGAC